MTKILTGWGGASLRDQLTISAAASGTWAIPAGTTLIRVYGSNITGGAAEQVFSIGIEKSVDSTLALFDRTAFTNSIDLTDVASSVTSVIDGWNGGASATKYGLNVVVSMPRSGADKTVAQGRLFIQNATLNNQEYREIVAVASAAEDHDALRIFVDAGTLTGTFIIEYS